MHRAHPALWPRAGGAAPAAVRSGRREGFCFGRAKGGPVWDRPAGNLMCARPAKVNPPPRAAPLRGAAGKLVAHGAGTHTDDGSVHWIFLGPAQWTPRPALLRDDKAGHRTGARAVPPKQYGGPRATNVLGRLAVASLLTIPYFPHTCNRWNENLCLRGFGTLTLPTVTPSVQHRLHSHQQLHLHKPCADG